MTEAEALERAIADLDAAWDVSAAHGMRDDRGSVEYHRLSPVPTLRKLLARLQE